MTSASEVESQMIMMQKIEKLTLYMIETNKRVKALEDENRILREQLDRED